jgi:hypothetical protein
LVINSSTQPKGANEGYEEEVSDCEKNSVLLKKGLAEEVSMSSVLSEWTPPIAKAAKD